MFAATDVPLNEYVNVFAESDTDPLDGTPLIVPRAGEPPVPAGTVIVTELSVPAVAVVKV